MDFEFRFPDIGEGVVEGEIVRWLVAEGDTVREDQPLVEVMTDKATLEIPSPRAGKVRRLHVRQGEVVQVGSVLLTIEVAGTEVAAAAPPKEREEAPATPRPAAAPAAAPPTPASSVPSAASQAAAKVLATPATRKLARELSVDLRMVRGSGPGGRIERGDVWTFARRGKGAAEPLPAAAPEEQAEAPAPPRVATPAALAAARTSSAPPGPSPAGAAAPASLPAPPALAAQAGDQRVPIRGIRKKIAEHMSRAKRHAAHFTYVEEVDCTRLAELHARLEPRAKEKGAHLTYLAYFARATARALREHPRLNAAVDDERGEIVLRGRVNLGIAVDTPQGLLVPVVKRAGERSLFDLSAEIRRLADEARAGRSRLEDLQGSTFTITSVGNLGGMFATPILNYPEVGILGVNRIHARPVVRGGQVVVREVCYLALTLDHRAVDGADGARFMSTLKGLLEEPALLFLEE